MVLTTPMRLSIGTACRAPSLRLAAARPIHSTGRFLASKDAQGKDDLKPQSNEYSKSGSDQESAAVEDAAFNPKKTRPEEERRAAGKESSNGNPLDASPANEGLGKPNKSAQDRPEGSPAETGDK